MSDHKAYIVLFILLGIVGGFWWHEYVAPKEKILLEAHECFTKRGYRNVESGEGKLAWRACLSQAEAQHGTPTLRAVGY